MLKTFKRLLFLSLICFNCISFGASYNAAEEVESLDTNNDDDYDSSYYEDEGRLLFKVRGAGVITQGKQKKLPPPTVSNPTSVGGLVSNGFGADTATAIFFNDNIAVELSLGFYLLRNKAITVTNVASNYGSTNAPGKRKDIYMIPLSVAPQFHIAPFGAIRPYIGGGVTGAYIFTRSKEFKVKNSWGVFAQAGIDFVAKDDTLITLDVRQYYLKTKVNYKASFIPPPPSVSSSATLNPLIISVGFGFKL